MRDGETRWRRPGLIQGFRGYHKYPSTDQELKHGGREEEPRLHKQFDHLRLDEGKPHRRELFHPSPKLMRFIKDNSTMETGVSRIAATMPEELHEKMKRIAAQNQRSLSGEVTYVLVRHAQGYDDDGTPKEAINRGDTS